MALLSDAQVGLGGPLMSDEEVGLTPSVGSDVLQSLPQYGETAISHTVGLPGDIANLVSRGVKYVSGKDMPHYTGSADVQAALNEFQGGPLYQPQTQVGKGGDVAAGFLPALIGGPEALATKLATRVAAPAAAVQGIEASPLPETAKPWAETATLLLSPFAANKVVGSTLNQIRRSTSMLPGRGGEIGILPTTAELGKAKTELERIHNTARDPQTQQAAKAAWDEVTKRYQGMEIIDNYTGGGRVRYSNASKYRQGLIKLQSDIEAGKVPDVFSPEQKAQIASVAEGSTGMMGVTAKVSKLSPFHREGLGAGAILAYLASFAGPEIKHFVLAGAPTAVAMVAKVAYPHYTAGQISKLVQMVQRGKKVPGAPAAFGRSELTYSAVPPPFFAAQRYQTETEGQ
jgi:hypothetical protein